MSKDKDFFNLLRRKIEIEPTQDFDRRFWAAFERENPPRRSLWETFTDNLAAHRLVYVNLAAAAALAFVLVLQHRNVPPRAVTPPSEVASVEEMMAAEPMLKQLDLFMAFDDVTAITDDDWKVLLAES